MYNVHKIHLKQLANQIIKNNIEFVKCVFVIKRERFIYSYTDK